MMLQQKHHKHLRCSSTSMSNKFALIFALAALCCLVVTTEAATQRRYGELADEIKSNDVDGKDVDEEVDQVADREEAAEIAEQSNEHRNPVINNASKQTIARPSNEDGRARRIIRRRSGRRRGSRRVRKSGRRQVIRRRGGRRTRGGVRRTVRRRSGRPFRG